MARDWGHFVKAFHTKGELPSFKAMRALRLFHNRGFQVFFVLCLYSMLSPILTWTTHRALYSISLTIKDILMAVMPLTMSFFIAHTIASFRKQALIFVGVLIIFESFSNFSCLWYAWSIGSGFVTWALPLTYHPLPVDFEPLWRVPWTLPSFWSPHYGVFVGLVFGMISAFSSPKHVLSRFVHKGKSTVEWVLTRIFSRLLPLFVLGFFARMSQTSFLAHFGSNIFLFINTLSVSIFLYILFFIFLGSFDKSHSLKEWGQVAGRHLRNVIGPAGTAFSTGCSLSTMPWTIRAAEKNLEDPDLARVLIPATTNIQQVGDCIFQGFLCVVLYHAWHGHVPDPTLWLTFAVVFTLARFATAAVLGGAIFLMLPIYERYLGFTPDMIAIVLALNTLLDPIVTGSNVMANATLCRVFEKVWQRIRV